MSKMTAINTMMPGMTMAAAITRVSFLDEVIHSRICAAHTWRGPLRLAGVNAQPADRITMCSPSVFVCRRSSCGLTPSPGPGTLARTASSCPAEPSFPFL